MSNKTAPGVQSVSEPISQEAAQLLVDVVLGNLRGRSGFRQDLSNLRSNDPEIWDEMLQEMRDEMVAQVSRLVHEGQWPTTVVDKE